MPILLSSRTLAATLILMGAAGAAFASNPTDTLRVDADYRVWMPAASDPVEYSLRMVAAPAPADTLAGISYLIEYTLHAQGADSQGFSAYLPGALYDYRPGNLREYHADRDPHPFAPDGSTANGVQNRTQFAGLLPDRLLQRFKAMEADTAYTVSRAGSKLTAVRYYEGQPTERHTLSLDQRGLPLSYRADTNLDQISEQSVAVDYIYNNVSALPLPQSEADLTRRYPDAFDSARTDDWQLNRLQNRPLPTFSTRSLDGGRLNHRASEPLDAPTVVAFLDPAASTTPATIQALRQAQDSYPGRLQLWLAVLDNRDDAVRELTGPTRPDETVLPGARTLARECGITDSPTLLLCAPSGKITQIIRGLNNRLADEVIQWSTEQ